MQALFYKGEDATLTFSSTTDLSGFTTKAVKYFTFGSAVKTAVVTVVNNYTFTAKLAKADTAELNPGILNIVIELTNAATDKIISKTIQCKLADAYLEGSEREKADLAATLVFNTLSLNINFVGPAQMQIDIAALQAGKVDKTTGYIYLGVATTGTTPAVYGASDRVYYMIDLPVGSTTLSNFGLSAIVLTEATRYELRWTGAAWSAVVANAATKTYVDARDLPMAPEIPFYNRAYADAGTIDKEILASLVQRFISRTDTILLNPHAASKPRIASGVGYLEKVYNFPSATYDAAQSTQAIQPFLGGFIALNEKKGIKLVQNQTQTGLIDFTDKAFLSSDSWTFVGVVKVNKKTSGTGTVVFLGNNTFWAFQNNTVTFGTSSTDILKATYSIECGKTYIMECRYSNGVGLIKINGVPLATTVASSAITFAYVSYNSQYPFDGNVYHVQVTPSVITEAESQLTYAWLRLQYPEIEGIGIGNQWWASSNFEGIVDGAGNIINEVQGATTDGNSELITNSTFADATGWGIGGESTISGGVARIYSSAGAVSYINTSASILTVGKWYRLTYDVVANAGGALTAGNASAPMTINTTVGVGKVFYFQAKDTQLFLKRASGITDITLDNIYCKEVGWSDATVLYNFRIADVLNVATVASAARDAAMWCHYNNDPLNGAVYGKLYNWYAAYALSLNPPKGWRFASSADYTQLQAYLGGVSVAGNKVKHSGTSYWASPSAGTNESGFTALPSGQRNQTGTFLGITNNSNSWTPSGGRVNASYDVTNFTVYADFNVDKLWGMSLRLIRNEPNGADIRVETTGRFATNISSSAKVLVAPAGYRLRELRFSSTVDLSSINVDMYDYANTTKIGTVLTGKAITVASNPDMIFAATQIDAPVPYTDRNIRITATGNAGEGMQVWGVFEKIFKS